MPRSHLLLCVLLFAWLPQARAQEFVRLPVQVDNETVRLVTQIYKPAGPGPFPTLIFHHGSTQNGISEQFSEVFSPEPLTDWFVARGWAVVLPSRRGRGGSEGRYDEGFSIPRVQGYSCEPNLSIPGAERALRDVTAATAAIMALPFVDHSRLMVGGQSRGGVLSVAHAGMNPGLYRGVLNFVGVWVYEKCQEFFDRSAIYINRLLLGRGTTTTLPMLWLYAAGDSYASLRHSQNNFADFQMAGGRGEFHALPRPADSDGHALVVFPKLWAPAVERYLAERNLPTRAGVLAEVF
ncbi:prolyl oligopeptidase family serine peptidase [Ferrovibrio sp.]|uniref:alpha/beta hydrolase family protein n=1 Tax=Ferrovibrio sp. TaxID=1917215 RepID=UPI001B74919A|nr:prolyl oligopeptidase family serine peptidase [Ferrovibrio sp.]MBP7064584.1 prolyl oligopeptidase family serine peptidase [Ferrovibrio sp.]